MSTSPSVSPVKEKITRERIIPTEELAAELSGKMPELWGKIEELAKNPQRWIDEDWWFAIIREDPKPSTYGGQNTLEQSQGVMEVRPGVNIPIDDRERVELAIKQKYGGKAYRLWLKRGRQKISEGKCINEAPPKYPDMNVQQFAHPLPNAPQSDANAIASKAIDTVANQPAEMMTIGINALRTAAELMAKNASAPAAPPPQSTDSDLDRAFKQAMIAKLLAPPPDPVETFLRIKTALGDGGNGSVTGNPVMERILNAAVDKILNPAPAITGRTTLLDLGREFVPVIGQVMHEYRLSREADAHIAELMRNAPPPQAQPNPPALPITQAAAPAPQPQAAPPPAVPPISFHQIEERIAKIVTNLEFSTDEAVDKVLEFLYDTDARLPGLLLNPPALDTRLKPGKDGLVMLFQFEPILQPCVTNLPRLSEFIDKFIVAATEAEAAEARLRAAAPNAAALNTAPAS